MSSSDNPKQGSKGKPFRRYGRKPEEERKGIPMLRYGKGNNFYKFREALLEVAMEKFGNSGKLINLEEHYLPEMVFTDFEVIGYRDARIERLELEEYKEHTRKLTKMEEDHQKLYGLIMQHMSIESKDEVAQDEEYEDWHRDKDPKKLWQAIIRMHKVDTVSNVDVVKNLAARKAYKNIKQGSFETLVQYSIRFPDTYKAYKVTATEERPVGVTEQDQALDFFHGLDQGRYVQFKTSMLNGWVTKAFDPPEKPNNIYRIEGAWVKLTLRVEGGTTATFVTIEEEARINKKRVDKNKREENKKKAAAATAAAHATGGANQEREQQEQKVPKDLLHIECFRCKQPGHNSTSKGCPLHLDNKKQKAKAGFINTTWADNKTSIFVMIYEEGEHEEHVINIAVHVTQGLKLTEVLLDNQANISIVHPMLLKNVRPAPKKIVIKGVGGPQLIVDKVGDLEGFFEVNASEHMKANILSFADVEDMYKITYKRGATFVVHMTGRNVEFKRKEKLYVADWVVDSYACMTVQENALVYTKEELRRTKEVYELIRSSGYPSPNEAMHLLTNGNVRGMPALTVVDLQRAYKMYGLHPEYVRGQLTKKKVSRSQVDLGLRSTDKNLRLYVDVMHLEDNMFLVTVVDPLNLTMQSYVKK